MKAIFVHLSDIHFGQERDGGEVAVNEDAKARLIDDARAEVSRMDGIAAGVIVTGDIAYSGKPDEYQKAAKWLAELTDSIGCARVNVQMVPGNHDIDRDKISGTLGCVLDSIRDKGECVLDPLLDLDEDRKVLYSRFEAYADFALDYQSELDLNGGFSSGGVLELAEGRTIKFVRLNSALICSKKDEKGQLILGRRQQVVPRSDGEEIIVLVHHPLDWFQDSEKARNYLRSRARVLISGHEHFPKLEIDKVEQNCDLMMLAAGATTPDELVGPYTYKYNILVFEWDAEEDALAVTVNPRTWDASKTRFRHDAEFMEGKSSRQILASPNFRSGPKPLCVRKNEESPAVVEISSAEVSSDADIASGLAVIAPDTATKSNEIVLPTVDQRLLQLRFFQELADGERLQALVELGAVPSNLKGYLDHEMERRLFRVLIKDGKAAEIEKWLDQVKIYEGEKNK